MPQAESPSGSRFCRQCGAAVPEGSAVCPRCGQRWYMDRVEQQGADLWQKIIEKRAAAGLGETPEAPVTGGSRELHCPHCMAVLKDPVETCPHCGNSTTKARIVPPGSDAADEPAVGAGQLNLPPSAKGLGTIKGAEQRAKNLSRKSKNKAIHIVIIAIILATVLVIGYLAARQAGILPASLDLFKETKQQITQQPGKTEIANISVSDITATAASVSWTANTPAYGMVVYGKTVGYGMTAASDGEQTSHKVALSGLEPGLTYHYAVICNDNSNKEAARSADQIFNTPASAATAPAVKSPLVKQFKVIPTDIGAFVNWTTDEPSNSQVLYGSDQQCSNSTALDPKMVTEHSMKLSGLTPNTMYYYRIKSANSSGGIALMDPPNTFNTLITVLTGYKIGERAPDLTLPIFKSQETISLRSFKGQKVLLTFWAVYCPECDRELALLQSLKNKNLPNVNIICVFLESKPDDIEKTIAKYKADRGELTVPVVVDMYKTAAHLYNVDKLPCTFFIDSDGIIRDVEHGNFNIEQVEQTLKDL